MNAPNFPQTSITPQYQPISSKSPEYTGMNFAVLRQEGIKHIEKLAGKIWTDYNTHDPGITILEAICYAITDLSYRLSFPMADLLASPSQESGEERKQFFTARQILTVNPLTIDDYRKLLIDIDGVKNAWLEIVKDSSPKIYYNPNNSTLNIGTTDLPLLDINLNGLYRVLIEKEHETDDAQLKEEVKARLHQHRNLCEDFYKIEILPTQEITVKAKIEIEEGFDANDLMAKIYLGLDSFISPSIDFFTLRELLEKGKPTEELFDGPSLNHGFIDDEQLQVFDRKDELHTYDMIHTILEIEGIKAVKSITLSSSQSLEPEEWALKLDVNSTPRLKDVDAAIQYKDITFYKGQIAYNLNLEEVQNKLTSLQQERKRVPSTTEKKDFLIPVGQYRNLSEYESIQNDFPTNYGIGELGLPKSASPKRKAQAKQLQAYLMFFDRLLANYFAQLDRVKDLFSFHKQENKTYFSQILSSLPKEVTQLLTKYPQESNEEIDLERRNRFLDYFMAQYCEKFTDYSLLLYELIFQENQDKKNRLIEDKISFLQDYPQMSQGRGRAFNYTDSNQIWNTDNVSGLKLRISRLLGIPETRQYLATDNEVEGFHLIEHILLRPRRVDVSLESAQRLTFSRPISQFAQSNEQNDQVTCSTEVYGLKERDEIRIFDAGSYNGIYSVTNIQPDAFDIQTTFSGQRSGKWAKLDRHADPYSFQISFVFPGWLPRFKEETFRQLIQEILIAETPAHITIYCHWFNKEEMKIFELAYEQWLKLIADKSSSVIDIETKNNHLIELLKIASTE